MAKAVFFPQFTKGPILLSTLNCAKVIDKFSKTKDGKMWPIDTGPEILAITNYPIWSKLYLTASNVCFTKALCCKIRGTRG